MKDQLPWGWLNAAATSEQIIDDTVVAVKINAMEAHWDDVVPCAVKTMDGFAPGMCDRPAYWVYRCPCGRPITVCTPHKVMADEWTKVGDGACHLCHSDFPNPIPWLPL